MVEAAEEDEGVNDIVQPERVVVVAPTGRDATVIKQTLTDAGIGTVACLFADMLIATKSGALGALIVAEEALAGGAAAQLTRMLRGQPAWSDVPLIVLLSQRRAGGEDPSLPAGLGGEGLALLLERPLRRASLVSAVKTALRARRRQYEVRDHIGAYERAATELERADRSKDEFLAMLAHELRNPLAPIRNAGVLLQRLPVGDPSIKQLSEMIARQSGHMTRLLDGLLDVSRITRGKIALIPEVLDAAAIARDAVEVARPLIEQRRHDLRLMLPGNPLWVKGDATRLTQVLGNLLINACKYTPSGGRIVLIIESTRDQVVMKVRDNGIGIEPALLPHIFDLFSQAEKELDRSEGGLGIGLAVVKGIIDMHKGSVRASSEGPGLGSEFIVELPRFEIPSHAQESLGLGESAATSSQRILIVDDNADLAQSTALLLRYEGHEVQVAFDGQSALVFAETFAPGIALLDIGLPGMNGFELARRLRARHPAGELLLIAITGYGQTADRSRSQKAGFDGHLVKPLDPNFLGKEIGRFVKERDSERCCSASARGGIDLRSPASGVKS